MRRGATNWVCFSGDDDDEELEEGEWIPEEDFEPHEDNFDQGFSILIMFFSFAFTLHHDCFIVYDYRHIKATQIIIPIK